MLAGLFGIEWLFWWQIPLLGVAVLGVFGGGGLLYVGGRFLAKSPKVTYPLSLGTLLLTFPAGGVVVVVVLLAGGAALGAAGAAVGTILGVLAALPVSWLIIKWMFSVSYGRAILAWLPTLGMALFLVPMLAAMLVPSLQRADTLTSRMICLSNLASIGKALILHQGMNDGNMPPSFDALIADGQPPKLFVCPLVDPASRPPGRRFDYFYMLWDVTRVGDPAHRMVACDFRTNHGDPHRSWLTADFGVMNGTEAKFQSLLALPVNADFAAGLLAAEGP